jgi:hypothetical protein
MNCTCGHDQNDHIYQEGACTHCSCTEFLHTSKMLEIKTTELDALAEKFYLASVTSNPETVDFIRPEDAYSAAEQFLNYRESRKQK